MFHAESQIFSFYTFIQGKMEPVLLDLSEPGEGFYDFIELGLYNRHVPLEEVSLSER